LASIEHRQCKVCEKNYDILTHRGETVSMDRDDDKLLCPGCDADDYIRIIGVPLAIELGDVSSVGRHYPRFDRGLGCTVNSKQHRKQICEARGLEPLEGGADVTSTTKEMWRQEDKDHDDYKKLIDRYDNDPDFSEYRRLKDRGAYDHWRDDA